MFNHRDIHWRIVVAGFALAAASTATLAADRSAAQTKSIPLKASSMIIEYNASAEDIGIQFFLDSDGWREIEIVDPRKVEIFGAETEGSLTRQGGGTELFLESVEPSIDELPFERFFRRFPEGVYTFRAVDNEGTVQIGRVNFSHDIPAGPEIVSPLPAAGAECALHVPLPVVISWNPVSESFTGDPLEITRYEVIVENEDVHFDVKLPAETGTQLTVSFELLRPGSAYIFEVLAIEAGGNQTITEGCFTTAR